MQNIKEFINEVGKENLISYNSSIYYSVSTLGRRELMVKVFNKSSQHLVTLIYTKEFDLVETNFGKYVQFLNNTLDVRKFIDFTKECLDSKDFVKELIKKYNESIK